MNECHTNMSQEGTADGAACLHVCTNVLDIISLAACCN